MENDVPLVSTRVRPTRLLTETQVKGAKPQPKQFKLADPGGLVLLVQPTGSKLWRYRFTLNGSEGMLALGSYPDVTLKRARELHREARRLVADGINPVHRRRELALIASTGNFGTLAEKWEIVTSQKLRQATRDQRRRELAKHLFPRFQSRDAASITRPELAQYLSGVSQNTPQTARNLRTHLNAIFEYGVDIGLVTFNPTPPTRVLVARRSTHHASLAASRMGPFLVALDQCAATPEVRIAMLLVVLTAARKNEVVEGTWSEIDIEGKAWTIPGSRMKAKRPHWIPLSIQAAELLAELRKLTGGRVHLFPNRVDPKRAMANRTLNALLDRLGFGDESTTHGMRSAFSTHFNGLGANVDVIEQCLAHSPADKVRAAYNHYDYKDERRQMLQAWADYLDSQRRLHRPPYE